MSRMKLFAVGALILLLVGSAAVADEAAYKAAGAKSQQCRQAIERFSMEGTCDNAAFTAKQARCKEAMAALKVADAAFSQNPKIKEAEAKVKVAGAELAAAKKKGAAAAELARLDKQCKAANDELYWAPRSLINPPERAKLQNEVGNLKQELFVDVLFHMDNVPAVKALTDAHRAAWEEHATALTAWNKERGWTTPLAYLEAQPKPYFKPGNTMLPLTRCAYVQPFEVCREFADNWGYALAVGGDGYLDDGQIKELSNPESNIAKTMAWAKTHPGKYKLSVHTNRYDPPSTEDVWTHDAEGHVLNGQAKSYDGTTWSPDMRGVISPEAPDSYWIEAGKGRAKCIAEIQKLVPISIVINSGEWGLGLWGQFAEAWKKDPKIQNAIQAYVKRGQSLFEYLDDKVTNSQKLLGDEVRKVAPGAVYIHYTWSGVPHRNRWGGWKDWGGGGGYKGLRGVNDLASTECYLNHMNSGCDGNMDLLTHNLNAIGQQLAVGDKLMYNWFWARDPKISMRQYRGYMKCIYMLGTLGGNAGHYDLGSNNAFTDSFPMNAPPNWLKQQMALSQVQALFSHLEDYLRNGNIVDDGKFKHIWSNEQPAYELLPKELEKMAEYRDETTRVEEKKDDKGWEQPAFDDSRWREMDVPGWLDKKALAFDQGVIWFRKTIEIPPALAGKELVLKLGPVDDDDITYWNGEIIGQTAGWQPSRVYKVPADKVKAGKTVIVVHVWDTGGTGGICGKPEPLGLFGPDGASVAPIAGPWRFELAYKGRNEATGKKLGLLPLGRPVRVVARKHNTKPEWLVEAWTADTKSGADKKYDATVTIPGAGEVKLEARQCGSTYLITLKDGKPVAKLLDPDEDNPSSEFRPLKN